MNNDIIIIVVTTLMCFCKWLKEVNCLLNRFNDYMNVVTTMVIIVKTRKALHP